MRNDRIKMIRRALKSIHYRRPLNPAFDRLYGTYRVDADKIPAIAKKALGAIKAHNIVAARFEDFGLTWHVRAYKMPSAKQLAKFTEAVAAFG